MSVSKSWAYVREFGPEKITAWAISQERAKYGGRPLGKTYWSNHKPGQRKPVKQVQKAGTTFFSYIDAADAVSGGGGESISHRLLKEAIAGLSGTKFKLGSHGEHDITITHGQTEKAIATGGEPYYADAYLHFTSTTLLGLRWSGEVYIEVHHTHAVPVDKQKELRRLRVPVVEVNLLDAFVYPYKDEDTSDPLEAAHVNRIRNMLQKGFLAGRVISDRRSVEFLEQEVSRLEGELREARDGWDAAKRDGADAWRQLKIASSQLVELEKTKTDQAQGMANWAEKYRNIQREFDAEKKRTGVLSGDLMKAKVSIAGAQKKKVRWYLILGGALLCVLGLCALVSYQRFIANQSVTEAMPNQPVAQSAAVSVPYMPARRAGRIAASHRHRVSTPASAIDHAQVDDLSQ